MTTTPTDSTRPTTKRRRDRRRALLAGGVVLGVGALITMAAWSDSVFTEGSFSTGEFAVEANVATADGEGGGWDTYRDSEEPATFSFPEVSLSPDDTVYAPIALRTGGPDYGADITMQGTTAAGGLADDLEYEAWTGVSFADCTDGVTAGGSSIGGGGLGAAADAFELQADGVVQTVCVAVTLDGASDQQGQSLDATWTFEAQSFQPG